MRRFTVLVIALVLAPGLQSAVVQTRPEVPQISTLPGFIIPDIVQLPEVIEPETPVLRPLPIPAPEDPVQRPLPELIPEPEVPVQRPLPVLPESEAIHPELVTVNPCDACFEYMTALIGQLTEIAVPESEVAVPRPLPEGIEIPEVIVPRPLPESVEVPEVAVPRPLPESIEIPELRPLPLPVEPEVGIITLPGVLPTEAESEDELTVQGRPLPEYIIRK